MRAALNAEGRRCLQWEKGKSHDTPAIWKRGLRTDGPPVLRDGAHGECKDYSPPACGWAPAPPGRRPGTPAFAGIMPLWQKENGRLSALAILTERAILTSCMSIGLSGGRGVAQPCARRWAACRRHACHRMPPSRQGPFCALPRVQAPAGAARRRALTNFVMIKPGPPQGV